MSFSEEHIPDERVADEVRALNLTLKEAQERLAVLISGEPEPYNEVPELGNGPADINAYLALRAKYDALVIENQQLRLQIARHYGAHDPSFGNPRCP